MNEIEVTKEGSSGGVTVVGSDAPTDYQIAPRNETTMGPTVGTTMGTTVAGGSQVSGANQPPPMEQQATTGMSLKKKRGRPRRYGPDGPVSSVGVSLSARPISASVPVHTRNVIDFSAEKRPMMKPAGHGPGPSIKPHQPKFVSENSGQSGERVSGSVGANFTPHIIAVNTGEDVSMKIISFSQQGPRAICILGATGMLSSVTLRQHDSSGGTLTYEGRFEIVSLKGSFVPSESGGIKNRTGGMSVSLASPDGRVLGGGVAGLLIAASPVQIVVGSFLTGNQHEQKLKKQKSECIITGPPSTTVHFSNTGMQENYGGQGYHKTSGTTYSTF